MVVQAWNLGFVASAGWIVGIRIDWVIPVELSSQKLNFFFKKKKKKKKKNIFFFFFKKKQNNT